MKNNFVADGHRRFLIGKHAAISTSESIEKKYAADLAKAAPAEKIQIRERMVEEFLRRKKIKAHQPSAGTLW